MHNECHRELRVQMRACEWLTNAIHTLDCISVSVSQGIIHCLCVEDAMSVTAAMQHAIGKAGNMRLLMVLCFVAHTSAKMSSADLL